jgi:hypothetical protein
VGLRKRTKTKGHTQNSGREERGENSRIFCIYIGWFFFATPRVFKIMDCKIKKQKISKRDNYLIVIIRRTTMHDIQHTRLAMKWNQKQNTDDDIENRGTTLFEFFKLGRERNQSRQNNKVERPSRAVQHSQCVVCVWLCVCVMRVYMLYVLYMYNRNEMKANENGLICFPVCVCVSAVKCLQ